MNQNNLLAFALISILLQAEAEALDPMQNPASHEFQEFVAERGMRMTDVVRMVRGEAGTTNSQAVLTRVYCQVHNTHSILVDLYNYGKPCFSFMLGYDSEVKRDVDFFMATSEMLREALEELEPDGG